MKGILPAAIIALATVVVAFRVRQSSGGSLLAPAMEDRQDHGPTDISSSPETFSRQADSRTFPAAESAARPGSPGASPGFSHSDPALPQAPLSLDRPRPGTKGTLRQHSQADRRTPSVKHAISNNITVAGTELPQAQPRKAFPRPQKAEIEVGPYRLPQPAVWADAGGEFTADPAMDSAIQEDAERLLEQISSSEFATDSVEYRQQWAAAAADSDQLFRKRYGGWAWMNHHVQAHHLAAARESDDP